MRLLAALAFFPMAAFAVTAPPLPPSGFADTEVSTNLAFSVDLAVMSRRGCGASCELAKADGLAYGLVLEVR